MAENNVQDETRPQQQGRGEDQAPLRPSGLDAAEWEATVRTVVSAVVSIRFCRPLGFDGYSARRSEATGFVVDARRG